jgi:hypothetical protein
MTDERYKLSKKEHDRIFQRLNRKILTQNKPQEHPTIIILGGQPGSGKSRLTETAKKSVFGDKRVAAINGDDYRSYHPQAREIYERHDKNFAELTDPDVRVWTSSLLEAAVNDRRDIIFEAAMRNKEPLAALTETRGYGFCLVWSRRDHSKPSFPLTPKENFHLAQKPSTSNVEVEFIIFGVEDVEIFNIPPAP